MSKLLAFLPFLIVFVASLYSSADLDLGWHLKYGEHFVKYHEILKVNTFSSEMTNYRYPNTSWVSDVLLYTVYSKLGFLGITLLAATVITFTFYFFSKAAGLTLFQKSLLFPLLLYLLAPQNAAGYRAQLLSFLFMGILFYLLTSFQALKTRHFILIPIVFLAWANSHGEYLTGLALFGIFVGIKITMSLIGTRGQRDKAPTLSLGHSIPLLLIFALSFATTLINPFGINIYLESLRHFGNPLQKYVIEWLPFPAFSALWWNLVLTGLASILGLFSLIRSKKLSFVNCQMSVVIFLLLALSFWSRRYAWSYFYFSVFLTAPLIAYCQPKNRKINTWTTAIILAVSLLVALISKNPLAQFTKMSWENYCQFYVGCSPKAAQYLVDHNLSGNLYTFYDWGGWLIANYPQIKPSMDGRMALWRDKTGAGSFEQYYALEQNWADIDKSKYDVALVSPRKPVFYRLLELAQKDKWAIKYQDNVAAVFVRKAQKK